MRCHFEEIQLHLNSLTPLLVNVSELDIDKHRELKVFGNQVMDVAYRIEDVIDSLESDAHRLHLIWFYDLLDELKLLSEEASIMHVTTPDAQVQNINNVTQVSSNMISKDVIPIMNELMVNRREEEEAIIDRLIASSSS